MNKITAFDRTSEEQAKLFIVAIMLMVSLFGSLFINTTNTFAATYTTSLSTSGSVTVDISGQGNGAAVGTDNLTVISTCPQGYNITIEGPSDTNLYLNGDSNNSAVGTYIVHSNGTKNNPATITGANLGTWGYSTTSSTGSGAFIGLTNEAELLSSKNTASASGGDSIPVYYGISVSNTLAPGSYQMSNTSAIIYYLTASEDCFSYLISFDANGGTGSMSNQRIYEGIPTPLTPNSFTPPSGLKFKEWNTSADGTGTSYSNEEPVTDISPVGSTLPLYAIWESASLYNKVAMQSKGTQTASDLQANITKTNSGVYEYNSTAFGADTDGTKSDSTKATIYYYRGVLDDTTGTYGSDGDSAAYPNYVKLDNTCWRIIRTTGSGGVKMIYNGNWTGSTCANATTLAQTNSPATSTFNGTANSQNDARQAVRIGYTHNSTYASTSSTTNVAVGTAYGSNNNYSVNNTNSTIKGNVETWFNNSLASYAGILESNAGYCNDRSSYTTETGTTASTNIRPYYTGTNTGANYVGWYGAQHRNLTNVRTPSLGCPSDRNIVDVYSTDTSAGGNGQLSVPAALLTADEASFAGSGSNTATNGSAYNTNSFLNTGSNFWTMSPHSRTGTYTYNIYLNTSGYLQNGRVDTTYGIRPVISLAEGVKVGGGEGTATSPWTVKMDEYTVKFNANGGSGTMNDQTIYSGIATALNPNSFTPPSGKIFIGWNTEADGSGISYDNREVVTDLAATDGTITLYAQWDIMYLYNLVANQTKGTQTASDLQATITKTNSGVYTYNSAVLGTASDASNDHTIYYYRGILDNTTGTYGSNGDGAAYPNYVRLGNTCWRIFRTTGSGGVKMIFNGNWTGSTCANATTSAQVTTTSYGSQAGSNQTNWYNNAHRVGYTYNASVDDSTTAAPVDTVFGSSSNYATTNTTSSNIKTYLENTWFTSANGISAYESILEPSAGYCNDRSAYTSDQATTLMTSIAPFNTSTVPYFGPYTRNRVTGKSLSLTCSRGTVDIYSTSSATDGNKQLNKPVALITIDEVALSGSGHGASYSSANNANSFLGSGSNFWTLSPRYRRSSGEMRQFTLDTDNDITGATLNESIGVRPVISIKSGISVSGGTGIATDPWIITAPH